MTLSTANILYLSAVPKKDVLFIIGDWNAKVGSQETPGVTGKSGLGEQNEAGQRLIEFCQENAVVTANTLFQPHMHARSRPTLCDPIDCSLLCSSVHGIFQACRRPGFGPWVGKIPWRRAWDSGGQ